MTRQLHRRDAEGESHKARYYFSLCCK